MKKITLSLFPLAALALAAAVPGAAQTPAGDAAAIPATIRLPNGFRPEGVATGRRPFIYAGSLGDGSVYRASLITGRGRIVVPPHEGRVHVGLKVDPRTDFIFVAGGPTGNAYVYDARDGGDVAVFSLTTEQQRFVNDVVVTRTAAYFTDSFRPVLYRLPLGRGGRVRPDAAIEVIPLGGDFTFVPGAFNANGIDATRDGRALIIVHSNLGTLYRVNPETGHATLIDLGGGSVASGDGILLAGRRLYVVQNSLNQVAIVRLNPPLDSAEIVRVERDPRFDIPTTIARFRRLFYVVNARFTTPPTPETPYTIERLK